MNTDVKKGRRDEYGRPSGRKTTTFSPWMRGNFNKIEASTTDGHFPAASPSKTTRKNAQRHRRTKHIPSDWKKDEKCLGSRPQTTRSFSPGNCVYLLFTVVER